MDDGSLTLVKGCQGCFQDLHLKCPGGLRVWVRRYMRSTLRWGRPDQGVSLSLDNGFHLYCRRHLSRYRNTGSPPLPPRDPFRRTISAVVMDRPTHRKTRKVPVIPDSFLYLLSPSTHRPPPSIPTFSLNPVHPQGLSVLLLRPERRPPCPFGTFNKLPPRPCSVSDP